MKQKFEDRDFGEIRKLYENQASPGGIGPLGIIDRLLRDIELSRTQYEDAKTSYESVATVIARHAAVALKIFPQGSMRLGTTVRPIGADHFDLDLVCWLGIKTLTPNQVYDLIWDALGANDVYRDKRRKKPRCIRLEYSPERAFHLDVIPSISNGETHEGLLYIPDREKKIWCATHPIAFGDWYGKIGERLPKFKLTFLNERIEAKSADAEPLPDYGEFEKVPLQRITQLFKHDRDEKFKDDLSGRPSSILLTTVTAHAYRDTVGIESEDLLQFVWRVAEQLNRYIEVIATADGPRYVVSNPVYPSENFAEKWTQRDYQRFCAWQTRLVAWLRRLAASRGRGIDSMLNDLSESFNGDRVKVAASRLGQETRERHEAGRLRVHGPTGVLGSVGTAIPKTVNFGKQKIHS